MIFTPRIMRKHIIASLTASFLLVRADIGENPDYDPFLLASGGELPDNSAANNDFLLASGGEISDDSANSLTGVAWDSTNLFTDPLDDSLQSSTDGLIAGAQPGCTSDADNDNVFFSRIRPRGEACLPPLNPPPNIYDLNTIFNQVAPPPPTLPKIPDRTTPDTDRSDLEKMWSLPLVDPDTKNGDEEEICPRELMGDSQIPVCSSPQRGRNELRLPQEDHWTLYNVRYCMSPEMKFVLFMKYFMN